MKRISKRMLFLLGLMGLLITGIVIFVCQYAIKAKDWAMFPGSPHVYTRGNLSAGIITDRSGTVLLDPDDGKTYAADETVRMATMHLLGDRYGYIPSPIINEYAEHLVGFSGVNGLYDSLRDPSKATLTISADVQKTALEALQGRKGTIGVYNYKTGEILCAVSAPTYDPDNMPDVEGDTTGQYDGVYMNRFLHMTYVPGSIYKILTTAMALEKLPDAETNTFYCSGSCEINGNTINCNGVHHNQTMGQALGNSCNVAYGLLGVQLGEKTMTEYAEVFKVEEPMEFDGIRTAAGSIDLKDAEQSDLAWSAIGQYTNMINPCRFMWIMGAIAGGGEGAMPYLVKQVGDTYKAEPRMERIDLSAETCDIVASYMRDAVLYHYGQEYFPDLYVCAKSGTAELAEGVTPHATFAGFIRDDNYPLAFIVVVENGGSGSATCAPIAGTVLKACCAAMDKERA